MFSEGGGEGGAVGHSQVSAVPPRRRAHELQPGWLHLARHPAQCGRAAGQERRRLGAAARDAGALCRLACQTGPPPFSHPRPGDLHTSVIDTARGLRNPHLWA